MKKFAIVLGAIIAAIAASACCILPLVLGVASAGTLGLSSTLTPYRTYLIALTLLMLGAAFYFDYRPRKAVCHINGQCATETSSGVGRYSRLVLWAVTAFTLSVMAYPQIAAQRTRWQMAAVKPAPASAAVQTATFAVSKMDCAACSGQIVSALKKAPEIYDASVDFDTKLATVRYNPARINAEHVRDAIEATGYPAAEIGKPDGTRF